MPKFIRVKTAQVKRLIEEQDLRERRSDLTCIAKLTEPGSIFVAFCWFRPRTAHHRISGELFVTRWPGIKLRRRLWQKANLHKTMR
jgi:hypothetical protein